LESDINQAISKATEKIRSNLWNPLKTMEATEVIVQEYLGTESQECFDQASLDGECFVYHTWPMNE